MLASATAKAERSVRILLVEDHAVVREGLRMLIESWPGFTVIGEASNGDDALAITVREKPDIILLDLHLGRGDSALDFLPQLLAAAGQGQVIILTAVLDPKAHDQAIRLGAMGLVLKEKASKELHDAILKVLDGEVWLDPKLTTGIINRLRAKDANKDQGESQKVASLTKRERELAILVGEGLTNKEIAKRLFVSESTVRHHLTSVFSKLGVSNRFELILLLYRHELV
jgi:DNA-binding NarL/FixJ family response regulator